MSDDYAYWLSALAGEKPEIHDGHPQCGFYRARMDKETPALPVAIWRDEATGEIKCKLGYQSFFQMKEPDRIWTWCANKPVRYADYLTACISHQWPTMADPNSSLLDEAERMIATTEDEGELETLSQKLEAARKAENAAALDTKRITDSKFKQVMGRLEARMKRLKQERQAA